MSQNVADRRVESIARIDEPHMPEAERRLAERQAAPAEVVAAAAGESPALAPQQIRLQAGQLASHLRLRLRDLDHREAHLHAQLAQLENDLRASRLWLREREEAAARREEELQREIAELRQRAHAVSAAEVSAEEARRRLESDLNRRQAQLAEREQQVAQAQAWLADESDKLRDARERLLQDQAAVARQLQGLHREHQELARRRQRAEDELAEQRRLLAESKTRFERERAEEARSLAARQRRVERREAAVERLRAELVRMHQEVLQTRLAIEELLVSQLADDVSVQDRTLAVSQLRERLAAHSLRAQEEWQQQKGTLIRLARQLQPRLRALRDQRAETEARIRQREAELGRQAASLAERAADLEDRWRRYEAAYQDWLAQRLQHSEPGPPCKPSSSEVTAGP